ncbi:MAG: hypothetical protein J6T10_13500 [Methanobrevibacter sp.]|nr:hypothetical protein [Methanobrevibacter sp.]
MLNLTGKINCFVNKNENKKGEVFYSLNTTVSHFDEETKSYVSKYLRVVLKDFNLEQFADNENIEKPQVFDLLEAWLDVRYWNDSSNNIQKEVYIYAKRYSYEGEYVSQKKQEAKPTKKSYSKK